MKTVELWQVIFQAPYVVDLPQAREECRGDIKSDILELKDMATRCNAMCSDLMQHKHLDIQQRF